MQSVRNRRIVSGWKRISRHIDRGVRTAKFWEVLLAMPVHRPALKNKSAVLAFTDAHEVWLACTTFQDREPCNDRSDENEKRVLRVLDNISTQMQQSCNLLLQVKMLEVQLRRRAPKARCKLLRSQACAADAAHALVYCIFRFAGSRA